MKNNSSITSQTEWGAITRFTAMASPCELLIECRDKQVTDRISEIAITEALRIEHKFSRFRTDNLMHDMNYAKGCTINIDQETYQLLLFARQCYDLSEGLFDISTCSLSKLWKPGQHSIPNEDDIKAALACVDFSAVSFDSTSIQLPANMQLDFGGIGKEYAVDLVSQKINELFPSISVLVNFGGDIACQVSPVKPWIIGIEDPNQLDAAASQLTINRGGLATSGDTRRFIDVEGKRYGHIINPQTGYPVDKAPRSTTVIAPNCLMAGMMATMAMLQGENAEEFLADQDVQYRIYR